MSVVPSVNDETTPFLFEYRHAGAEWGIVIHATSREDARERLKVLPLARFQGEVKARVPAPGAGLIRKIYRALTSR